jgi:hypothetical protein
LKCRAAARNTMRPMRPNPLMPSLMVMGCLLLLSRVDERV